MGRSRKWMFPNKCNGVWQVQWQTHLRAKGTWDWRKNSPRIWGRYHYKRGTKMHLVLPFWDCGWVNRSSSLTFFICEESATIFLPYKFVMRITHICTYSLAEYKIQTLSLTKSTDLVPNYTVSPWYDVVPRSIGRLRKGPLVKHYLLYVCLCIGYYLWDWHCRKLWKSTEIY